jgi:hypothetical protein
MGEPSSPRAGLTGVQDACTPLERQPVDQSLNMHHFFLPAGGVGEMSTPELLAKREQRRRVEAQAAALSRPTLARKLLHPVQQHAAGQQAAMQHQHQPSSVSGLAGQQGGRSIFSRAGLKRPAPTAQAAAPTPAADTGVSAAELAKVSKAYTAMEWQQIGFNIAAPHCPAATPLLTVGPCLGDVCSIPDIGKATGSALWECPVQAPVVSGVQFAGGEGGLGAAQGTARVVLQAPHKVLIACCRDISAHDCVMPWSLRCCECP